MYPRILVPLDHSLHANDALKEAVKLADGQADLRLVYVVEDGYPLDDEAFNLIDFETMQQAAYDTGERTLFYAAQWARKSGAKVEPR